MMAWFVLAAILATIDLGIKKWINGNKTESSADKIFKGKVTITKSTNSGAFLGVMKDKTAKLAGFTLICIGILMGLLMAFGGRKGNFMLKLGLTLMLGGAISNAYERVNKGEVTDYFSLNLKRGGRLNRIVFNIGDWFIFIGAIFALLSGR